MAWIEENQKMEEEKGIISVYKHHLQTQSERREKGRDKRKRRRRGKRRRGEGEHKRGATRWWKGWQGSEGGRNVASDARYAMPEGVCATFRTPAGARARWGAKQSGVVTSLSSEETDGLFFFFFFVKDLDVRVLRREIRLCIFLSFMSYLQGLNYPFNYSFCKGKSEEKISLKCISPLKVKMQTRRYRALWQTSAEGSALAYFAKTFPREPPGRLDAAPGAPTLVIPGGPRT